WTGDWNWYRFPSRTWIARRPSTRRRLASTRTTTTRSPTGAFLRELGMHTRGEFEVRGDGAEEPRAMRPAPAPVTMTCSSEGLRTRRALHGPSVGGRGEAVERCVPPADVDLVESLAEVLGHPFPSAMLEVDHRGAVPRTERDL